MTKEESFIPEGYEAPATGGGHMKLLDGDNVFRVLSSSIMGYEYWTEDNKPVRSKVPFTETPNIKTDKDGKAQKVRHFWAFVVWNYATKNVEILEITQSSIQNAITGLVKDKDWGNPKGYDIKINRTGANLETKYSINPKPHKEISADIIKAYTEKAINLEAIYENKNPFDGDF